MRTIKILFVEDHDMVRNGIKLMLKNQKVFIADIDEAADGVEAVKMASTNEYDVILLDVNLPRKDGVSVAKLLTSKQKDIRILALSMHQEDFIVKQMLEAGALGYILKNSGIEELTKAILTVYDYGRYYSNEVSQIIINSPKEKVKGSLSIEKVQPLLQDHDLTKREIEILKYIAEEYTDKEIAEKLQISYRTVGNHRNKLLQKLQVKRTAGLVAFAVKNEIV